MMSEEDRRDYAKNIIEWNRLRMQEHLRQQAELQAKKEGRLGNYNLSDAQFKQLMDTQTPDTLHAEDCSFLWACGIRADQDLVSQGAMNGR